MIKRQKKKPRKKQIINEDGDIEEVEEIIESSVESEYDEETGKKLPKKRKYVNSKGDVYEVEEPSEEASEPTE